MEYVEKALTTVTGLNLNREDLSNTISQTDGPMRPVSQAAKQVVAKNTTHQWNEQGLNTAGRNNVAASGATYAEGALPPTNTKNAVRQSNITCRTGRTAQVTDDEIAAFNGGGAVVLADGEMERVIQDALDFETALATVECLNQIEWMHVIGDQTNATMEGGETTGLVKWITTNGLVVGAGTTGTPITFAETLLKDAGRGVAQKFPSSQPNTLLVPPELIPDINATIASGASRPLVQVASGTNDGFVGGASVDRYNTGFSKLAIKEEPYLSPAYNTAILQPALVLYNDANVAHAQLRSFRAEGVARTDTSLKRTVTCVYAQEHRVAKGTAIIPNVISAIA